MRDIAAILVDWGTSNLRLWAVDSSQNVLATHREASGMRTLTPDAFEAILMSCLDRLGAGHAECPIIMCGMVGSRQGWTDAGYVPVPASLATLPGKAVRIKTRGGYDARILPGIARHDPQLPDVMRSEETQLLGLKSLMGGQDLHGLVCMPGSHAKWVHLAGGVVSGFHTAITGELIASVTSSTVVRHAFDGAPGMLDVPPYNAVFRIAVEHALKAPANILNAVFATRP
ncbi:MAG: 2-dehydro-3-deoxygalactonokinase, partial [Pseudomonadota bacterium]